MSTPKKTKLADEATTTSTQPNGWVAKITGTVERFSVTISASPSLVNGIVDGDAVALLDENNGKVLTIAFGRIYRVRSGLEATTLYFDALLAVEPPMEAASLGLPLPSCIVGRVHWPAYTAALKSATGKEFKELLPFGGKTPDEQDYLRLLLQLAVMDDLHGPANGPEEEVIGMSVRDRYLVGKLSPKTIGAAAEEVASPSEGIERAATKEKPAKEQLEPYKGHNEPGAEFNSAEGSSDPDETDQQTNEASASQSLVPSSLGLTFCIDGDVDTVELEVRWGRYERGESATEVSEKTNKPVRAWKRIPSGGSRHSF